jgi:hypothetical protein
LDYLEILMEALKRQGGHYAVVSEIQEVDVELPLMTSPATFDEKVLSVVKAWHRARRRIKVEAAAGDRLRIASAGDRWATFWGYELPGPKRKVTFHVYEVHSRHCVCVGRRPVSPNACLLMYG